MSTLSSYLACWWSLWAIECHHRLPTGNEGRKVTSIIQKLLIHPIPVIQS